MVYSQTLALEGDEGFHLLAAQLIGAGKKPYVDFFYQHAPLYALLNAAWMSLFGQSWRAAHVLSALLAGGSVLLVADFVYVRIGDARWKLAAGLTAALFVALHVSFIRFATVGQPYAVCLFLMVAAFRLSLGPAPFGAGLAAGASAASWLLSAPAVAVLLAWMVVRGPGEKRLRTAARFLAGAAIPFAPLIWLLWREPRRVLFDVVEFHLFYRMLDLPPGTGSGIRTLVDWLASVQGLLLAAPAAAAVALLITRRTSQDLAREEFYLCAWLSGGLGLAITAARPVLFEYFVLMVPFLAILAAVGIAAIGSTFFGRLRPGWLAAPLVALFAVGTARWASVRDFRFRWADWEQIAAAVNQVTPANGWVYAEPAVYFAGRRTPPPGLENSVHALRVSADLASYLHVVPQSRLQEWLSGGRFATVVMWNKDPRVESVGLGSLYGRRGQVSSYYVFWEPLHAVR
jgi:hypothetical protein